MSGETPAVREALPVYEVEVPETERVPPGYRKTEVGMIPEDWEQTTIGECTIKVGSGITPTGGSLVYKRTGRAFLRSQNVGWGQLLMNEIAYIDEQTHESFKETEVKTGDVLLNITGASIGRSAVADYRVEGGNVNQHVCIIRPKEKQLDPRFLSSFLLSSSGQRQIDSFQAGGNREGLNFMQIRSFLLPLPPLHEQRAIAAALSDVNALISALDRLIAKKHAVKTAAMQQLLTGKQRLQGFSGEWETRRLGDVCQIISGGTPSTSVPAFWAGEIPWCTPTDITENDDKYLSTTNRTISEDGLKYSSATILPRGALLLCTRATIGEIKIAEVPVCTNQGFKSLVCGPDASNDFLFYKLVTLKDRLRELGVGSTFLEVSRKDIAALEIPLPKLGEQTVIAAVLSDMDAEIEALEARREKTRQVKQGMMQELLTGRTRLV